MEGNIPIRDQSAELLRDEAQAGKDQSSRQGRAVISVDLSRLPGWLRHSGIRIPDDGPGLIQRSGLNENELLELIHWKEPSP